MWSTGSILGTFFTGFVFVSYLGSNTTMYMIALVLLVNGLFLHLLRVSRQFIALFIVATIIAASAISLHKTVAKNIVYQKESAYYAIKILDTNLARIGDVRMMFLDFDAHSMERADKKALEIYTEMPVVFPFLNQYAHDVLVIGGGSEAISKNFSTTYPTAHVTTVEIDPAVVQASEQFFNSSGQQSDTRISDGRVFLQRTPHKYDIIFSDAFNSFVSVPWHMSTQEFNALAFDHLNDNGIYAVNFISAQTGDNSLFFQSMLKTFKETFPNFHVFALGNSPDEPQNIILMGIKSADNISDDKLRTLLRTENIDPFLSQSLITNPGKILASDNVPLLSDNFAPTERLMAPLMGNYFSKYSSLYYSLMY
jgi:spermidine synthase